MSISTQPPLFGRNWSYNTARHKVENRKIKYKEMVKK